ncbi:hypothetical protein BaRGS_00028157 [Batillaria attramentaria]|uniref:NACHT domain-containing protein n=1 Tax=Batillaria attramentaria TaxID=370345 RepID=A0ABD0K0R0_9CAEN
MLLFFSPDIFRLVSECPRFLFPDLPTPPLADIFDIRDICDTCDRLAMEECLREALQALYIRHYCDVTSLSCYLERQLPLREPFFQLKRVPHFQVRDDLHHSEAPAYTPVNRLESTTPEDLAHRGRAGCRRVLLEGDIGTGKTFLCYYLLQQWAQPKNKCFGNVNKTPRLDDISTFKLVVYVDCVRLAVSDFLAKCQPTQKRHLHVIACALLELVSPMDSRMFQDRVYDWLFRNQSEVCVIFDNVDASDTWQQIIEETLREHHGFGKIVVCVTPGRISKKNIDSLFYSYGLHPDYSCKLVISRLKRISVDIVHRATIPKELDSSQELLRNPLTMSLLSTYLKQMNPKRKPETQFDFIEDIVSSALIGDSYPVSPTLVRQHSDTPPTSLMSICEIVAFECLETNTNYFCKYKFPSHFWTKHLCDCRILHEVHDVAKQGSPVVSFTSRCIRDYLASKRVCRYLLSDRDSQHFLHGLIHKRQFHSVVKFCIRQFVKLGRLDMVQRLLEKLMAVEPRRWIRAHRQAEAFSRGRLLEQKEVLSWLRETDFNPDLMKLVATYFPSILELSYSECPPDTIRDFVRVAEDIGEELGLQGVVVYMDGMFVSAQLGYDLARALRRVTSLTNLVVCLRCVVDTGFVVNFLCELFDGNDHVTGLTLEGPFNSAENLTPGLHRRVKQVFSECSVGLKSLCLEHVNYHHRVAYLLSCWPPIFEKLEIRKCNLDNVADKLSDKLRHCRNLTTLVLEHCHVLTSSLEAVLRQMCVMHEELVLKTVCLNLLSSARHFTRSDARKPNFKPSVSMTACRLICQFVVDSQTLKELALCHDGIDDVKFQLLTESASMSCSLTSLDLTGNVIGDDAYDDVTTVLLRGKKLQSLFLHENNFSHDTRKLLIKRSLDRDDLKLSL